MPALKKLGKSNIGHPHRDADIAFANIYFNGI